MSTPLVHTLVVTAHADPRSLTHHIATEVGRTAGGWGTVEIADLATQGFDPRFSAEDRATYLGLGDIPADVASEQARLDRATDVVLVFPVYWWSMPALLKGWIDRVFINGWAFDHDPSKGIRPQLGKLTTHVVPVAASDQGLYDRHGYEKAMRTQIEHGLVEYCGSPLGVSTFVYDSEDPSGDLRTNRVGRVLGELEAEYQRRYGPLDHVMTPAES
ncbi:NAD(P)H-dependent oxidoreductase [Aeromicrobium sp. CF3.5]|uniref:NAD(P)H-dependent oxidoreductase n=1 Tax=Aeromicrobium sp. CF3.5 TaxID=3373078 RepID=UPI003EE794E7